MKCECGEEIDFDRIQFLKLTKRPILCLSCSTEDKREGLMVYSHKTAPSLTFIPDNKEAKRQAYRANKRRR